MLQVCTTLKETSSWYLQISWDYNWFPGHRSQVTLRKCHFCTLWHYTPLKSLISTNPNHLRYHLHKCPSISQPLAGNLTGASFSPPPPPFSPCQLVRNKDSSILRNMGYSWCLYQSQIKIWLWGAASTENIQSLFPHPVRKKQEEEVGSKLQKKRQPCLCSGMTEGNSWMQ